MLWVHRESAASATLISLSKSNLSLSDLLFGRFNQNPENKIKRPVATLGVSVSSMSDTLFKVKHQVPKEAVLLELSGFLLRGYRDQNNLQ